MTPTEKKRWYKEQGKLYNSTINRCLNFITYQAKHPSIQERYNTILSLRNIINNSSTNYHVLPYLANQLVELYEVRKIQVIENISLFRNIKHIIYV